MSSDKLPSDKLPSDKLPSDKLPSDKLPNNYYFDNNKVEKLLIEYQSGGCINVDLRDEIMSHANELIINVIRTHNLHNIYGGKDESSFNDLFQIAWLQIESTLYKFDSAPGHAKLFNLWSQIARTVILAAIKKDSRDKKNAESYRYYLDEQAIKRPAVFDRFMNEAKELFKYNEEYLSLINEIENLYLYDSKPYEGFISKLSEQSNISRAKICKFIKILKILSFEFTDSPVGEFEHQEQIIKPSTLIWLKDED